MTYLHSAAATVGVAGEIPAYSEFQQILLSTEVSLVLPAYIARATVWSPWVADQACPLVHREKPPVRMSDHQRALLHDADGVWRAVRSGLLPIVLRGDWCRPLGCQ